jgi:hypothetical protein
MIGLLGGEPTLHPGLSDVTRMVLSRGFKIRMFSNGILKPEALETLSAIPTHDLDLIVNVGQPEGYDAKSWALLTATLRTLSKSISLSHTLCSEQGSRQFLVDLIADYDLRRRIRLGLAHPNPDKTNSHLRPEEYPSAAQAVLAFSELTDSADIAVTFDCGFPLCMFSEADLGKLALRNVGFRFYCTPALDIGTDLTLWHCFPLARAERRRLSSFPDMRAAQRYFIEIFRIYRSIGIRPECAHCRFRRRLQCAGGCIAHTVSLGLPLQAAAEQ